MILKACIVDIILLHMILLSNRVDSSLILFNKICKINGVKLCIWYEHKSSLTCLLENSNLAYLTSQDTQIF